MEYERFNPEKSASVGRYTSDCPMPYKLVW
jgi:hypothetical protein